MEATEDGKKNYLDRFTVGSVPTVIYIPDFITESEQVMLLNNVWVLWNLPCCSPNYLINYISFIIIPSLFPRITQHAITVWLGL